MPYSSHVKALAHKLDPECWKSYSGQPIEVKRGIDVRRLASLKRATTIKENRAGRSATQGALYGCGSLLFSAVDYAEILAEIVAECSMPSPLSERSAMPPMKIAMILHFFACCEPFAPEKSRTSAAYTTFVRELLRDGMIERPTKAQRKANPGWAYTTTAKGDVYVEALKAVPLPVQAEPQWIMPEKG